jgi:hypothetical protein
MSTKQQKNAAALEDTAKKFVHQLAKTIADNDPAKEKAYQESEEKRDAEVTKKLEELFAKKKQKEKKK